MKVNISGDMKDIFEEFLVEAEEILENLDQDLVELENNPNDKDLLNKIFRGIHTLKGGAGFLNLKTVVEVAHRVEDVFNKLRNGEMGVTPELMDTVLKSLDFLKTALQMLREREEIPDEDDIEQIVNELDSFLQGSGAGVESKSKGGSEDVEFVEGISEELKKLIRKFPGKDLGGSLEEIILMPPDERPIDVIPEIEELVQKGKDIKDIVKVKSEVKDNEKVESAAQQVSEVREEAKPKKGKRSEVIRVDVDRVESLMNLVGEIILGRNRILRLVSEIERNYEGEVIDKLSDAASNLDRTASDLQVAVMKLRMQPIKKVFSKFPRIVRDLSRKLGKKVNLIIEGEDTELDRSIIDKLEDPLIHLVRNALDHGIPSPEERMKKGKPEVGTVKLFAYHEGDHIVVGIEDDGKGMDPEAIKRKPIEKGLISSEQAGQLTDREAFELIFMPGFSTAEKVSEVSGRGVGMDVVANTIRSLRGTIEIDSGPGRGTKMLLKLPLTVAIIRTLMVGIKGQVFAIPLHTVVEIVKYLPENVKNVGVFKSFMLRDEVLPFFSLAELLEMENSEASGSFVVIVKVGEKLIAVSVEGLFGEEEIVIKSLGDLLGDIPGIVGASIAGDGKVVLIIDLNTLISDYRTKLIGVKQ